MTQKTRKEISLITLIWAIVGIVTGGYILLTADFPLSFYEIRQPFFVLCLSTVGTLQGIYYLLFE